MASHHPLSPSGQAACRTAGCLGDRLGSVEGLRARRVPGADYHEGQGGSQRRGTRWILSCAAPVATRNFELDAPQPSGSLSYHRTTCDLRTKRYTNRWENTRMISPRSTRSGIHDRTRPDRIRPLVIPQQRLSPGGPPAFHCTAGLDGGLPVFRRHGRRGGRPGQRGIPAGRDSDEIPLRPATERGASSVASSIWQVTTSILGRIAGGRTPDADVDPGAVSAEGSRHSGELFDNLPSAPTSSPGWRPW